MEPGSLRIVFMGTPDFAVEILDQICKSKHLVVAVVTVPDKPAGRGMQLRESAVKQYALQNGLPVLQPEKLKNEDFLHSLQKLNADLFVVVAFRMLPEIVWRMPRLGTFNLHASLLPQYRGAAPINHAIINGETKTGVTSFFIDNEIDTGKILLSEEVEIMADDCAGSLHDKLMHAGARLVIQTIDGIGSKTLQPVQQSEFLSANTRLKTAPKLSREFCQINWNASGKMIYDFIRGLSPYPAAYTTLRLIDGNEEIMMKIFKTKLFASENTSPGKIITDNKSYIHIHTRDGYLNIIDLQLSGKKRMSVLDFLRGFKNLEQYQIII
jgi:methionyl-tRNA formyltransferase